MAEGKRFGSNVRCVTLMGHVDHGKSSYADSLLAANNIISARMAGKIRYLDSRLDEQERGITMESSAVSLGFKFVRKGQDGPVTEDYMINLIDTPGHIDFSSEVSTASRLCDGSLILVDAVEGVCTQTISVLRQAWSERLKPILVINKMDRLVTELQLAPIEAYHHLQQLVEQVNAVMGSFFASERMEDNLRWREERERRIAEKKQAEADAAIGKAGEGATESGEEQEFYEERDDEDIYFDPARGNVIFASAIDNWAFRIDRFSQLYATKLGIKEANLRRVLWGDFYLDPKSKRVVGQKQKEKEKRSFKPMFVQFVLENIWAVYGSVVMNRDQEKIDKIVKALNLKVHPRDLKSKDARTLLSAIFSQWLPLATCTFSAIVSNIPAPSVAQRTRIPKMLYPDLLSFQPTVDPKNKLEQDLFDANAGPEATSVAYVSKMFAVKKEDLPEMKRKPLTADEMRERARAGREKAALLAASTGATVASGEEESPVSGTPLPLRGENGDAPQKTPDSSVAQSTPLAEPQAENADGLSSHDEVLIGFSRLYSGTLRAGQTVYAVLPKYDSSRPSTSPRNERHLKLVKVEALYMIMGRDLVAVEEVPAGNVFGIRGLEGIVLRNATLVSPGGDAIPSLDTETVQRDTQLFVNLAGIHLMVSPIVRVALEPAEPFAYLTSTADMPKLVEGLRLLNQADPCVEILVQETGEHVILGAGELHLERCLRDLQERFAKCEVQASQPIVPFRETAVKAPDMAPPKSKDAPRGTVHGAVANSLVTYTVRVVPLPEEVTAFLIANVRNIRRFQQDHRRGEGSIVDEDLEEGEEGTGIDLSSAIAVKPDQFWPKLADLLSKAGPEWRDVVDKIWAFGPRRVGPNLLVDRGDLLTRSLRQRTDERRLAGPSSGPASRRGDEAVDEERLLEQALQAVSISEGGHAASQPSRVSWTSRDLNESIDAGFQLATLQGPLCSEPVQGMAYFVEKVELDKEEASKENVRSKLSQVTGSLITSVKEACRNGLLDWSPRLMLAMYTCDIQASTDVLGKVYAVVARRRGRITSEEMKEGTSFFTIRALLPVVESFGFADDIRKRTSGAASPQLVFSGFEMYPQDPFWVPTTEEELEDLGEKSDRENVAKKYMDAVRKRKGLFVSNRMVEHAEKQRTLKKN